MKLAAAGARVLHRTEQNGMLEEFAVLNHQLNAGRVHVNDAPGANIQVADFAVAHLPFGQADVWAAGLDQGVRIFLQQAVVSWLSRERDSVSFGFGPITPAVKDDKNEW